MKDFHTDGLKSFKSAAECIEQQEEATTARSRQKNNNNKKKQKYNFIHITLYLNGIEQTILMHINTTNTFL